MPVNVKSFKTFLSFKEKVSRFLATFPDNPPVRGYSCANLRPCYGPLFPARAKRAPPSRAKEKGDHNMGARKLQLSVRLRLGRSKAVVIYDGLSST